MRTECLPVATMPHSTALFRDFLSNFPRVQPFYSASAVTPTYAMAVSGLDYPTERRATVASTLDRQNRDWRAGKKALENVERFKNGASAIVTGQQVSLFGGPMFAVLKALTAIKEADHATRAGIDCVPIFWLASEDHDLEEVSSVSLLTETGALRKFVITPKAIEGAPVGAVRFGEEIRGLVEEVAGLCSDAEVAEIVRDAYRPGVDFTTAFAKLFTRLFADFGLILLDPSDAKLHKIAQPLLVSAAERAEEVNTALMERGKSLESAGYHAQVKVTPSSTLLFCVQDGVRLPVHRTNGSFTMNHAKMSVKELAAQVSEHPEKFSANALFRPVMQDYLLPTLAYVGGPAEVAYFAQSEVVYQKLLGRVTPILSRMSATVVEPKIERLLTKYSLSVTDAFVAPDELQRKIAAKSLPAGLTAEFDAAQKQAEAQLERLTSELKKLDPTLEDAAKHATSKMMYQLSKLRTRAGNAEVRRTSDIARHAGQVSNALFPHKDLQERGIAGVSFLGRNGRGLLRQLLDASETECAGHQVIYL